ncbi:hypothetical protein JB92DRAFT_2712676, partial [Gautieria morchelliformis]
VVAAAILTYDYLLTVEREARLVWPVPWNVGKVLFFLTRCVPRAFILLMHAPEPPAACQGIFKTIGYLLGVGTLIAESILAVRTWVIWQRNRRVGAILIVALVGFWTPIFYFLSLSLNSLVFAVPPEPNLAGCFLFKQNPILWVVFVFLMTFETREQSLSLSWRLISPCSCSRPTLRRTQSTLVSVLYRDGILNYIYLCLLSIVNVVVLLTAPHGYSTLLTATQRALHSVLSARILLHLREAAVMRGKSTMSHVTSEMGGFTINRSSGPGRKSTPSSALGGMRPGKTRSGRGHGRAGATYPEFGLESVPTTMESYISTEPDDAALPAIWFEKGEVGAEELFGEKREGELPETVTWFGDQGRDRDLAGGGGGTPSEEDVELDVGPGLGR